MRTILGIDVGKTELELHLNGKNFTIANDGKTFGDWVKKYGKSIDLYVFEPTGGYESTVMRYLDKLDLPYKSAHANHIRSFAKAKGQLAKTDKIDAKMIAQYAERFDIQPSKSMSLHPRLEALLARRTQLVSMRREEKCRRDTALAKDKLYGKDIEKHIRYLDKSIKQLEVEMNEYIKAHDDLKAQVLLYESVPGIGRIVAISLVIELPELLTESSQSLSALVGLAPMNRDSGKLQGRRKTMGGRARIRGLLYLGAVSAIRCNKPIKAFYERLKQAHKPTKVALVACARKLLIMLRSIVQRGTPWVENLC